MPNISEKIRLFSPSVIAHMSHLSEQFDAVNLSEGFPDFPPPQAITDKLAMIAAAGPHQYSPDSGAANFRQALVACRKQFTGQEIDAEKEIVVTCGGTEAIMTAVMTVADKGDKIIIFSPFYEAYGTDILLAGAEPLYVHLKRPDFSFDPDELENAFKQHPKAIILCNPSNPCGKVFTAEELTFIADLTKKYDTFAIVDEVYSHIVYEPAVYTYLSALPGMYERTIQCSSLSKTYSITGWRIGYIIASPDVIVAAKQIHVYLTISAPSPLQEAAIAGLQFGQEYYDELLSFYTRKRQILIDGLDRLQIPHNIPQGAFYLLLDIQDYGYESDVKFAEDLVEKIGVGAVPCSSFFDDHVQDYVRLHFAVKDETLYAALNRFEDMKKKLHL
ncbi:pyridoxal phosphate-dependent aminotransferase [Megasphaera vaginalis (ex Srinivasan et al. 2021)]|uniref:Aminotransferase n=1 Tax=Megasphaera vaginalis (ex Srinivasan et al. 2021) TaxID=1111454 RepID=U7UGX5_9FIRM|nr:pyridoxal phosphate-dependent aminotransferase [Megasphaera vaginalis (ex Srinivasan et al. 2021)]ERT58657.1 aminotransferase, class I/II [Megasphaera vaginalis (ex Srinivasan et al. 2021)]